MMVGNNVRNKGGWVGGGIYLIIALGFIVYANVCSSSWCAMSMAVPLFPWIIFLFTNHAWASIIFSFIINLIIFSLIGYGIGNLLRRGKQSPQNPPPAN